jgi:Zn-dependent M28 family amino/carboxypeptidase
MVKMSIYPKSWLGWIRLAFLLTLFLVPLTWAYLRFVYMPGFSYRGALPPLDEEILQLKQRLETHVQYLSKEIGPRNLAHAGSLEKTLSYMSQVFHEVGYATSEQVFDVGQNTAKNLEVEIQGSKQPKEIIVVGAHYDTQTNAPGADDNGSGVAGLLEIARLLRDKTFARTVRYVAFVNEEPPYFHSQTMGSLVYAKRCREREENILGMVALEMIGCYSNQKGSQQYPRPFNLVFPSRGNFIGFIGNASSASFLRQCIGFFRESGSFPSEGAVCPDRIPDAGFSDHWSFWQQGYPAIMVTDTAYYRNTYYHTPEDTADKLDFESMARVVHGLAGMVEGLAGMGGE